ncbi:MAG: hypothetical protein HYX76_03120 [Acidobacteria bacterium]|nr:hypothetical protein [Acidobacteriota bacterium]
MDTTMVVGGRVAVEIPDDRVQDATRDPLVRIVVGLIGIHSCVLGLLMLLIPGVMLRAAGFPEPMPIFFPSQTGIFLLILGVCYLLALSQATLISVIVIAKACAVAFLFVHAAFLSAPPVIWAAGAGDAMMLIVLTAALARHARRCQHAKGPRHSDVPRR